MSRSIFVCVEMKALSNNGFTLHSQQERVYYLIWKPKIKEEKKRNEILNRTRNNLMKMCVCALCSLNRNLVKGRPKMWMLAGDKSRRQKQSIAIKQFANWITRKEGSDTHTHRKNGELTLAKLLGGAANVSMKI